MINFKPTSLLYLPILVATGGQLQAALVSRGEGLVYDTILDVTWLTTVQTPSTFSDAMSRIGTLNSNEFKGYSNWRLPKTLPVNGVNYNHTFSYDGSTDIGYNIKSPNSELAHLFYVGLGNLTSADESETDVGGGLVNTGPFVDLNNAEYFWSETAAIGSNNQNVVFTFRMRWGDQSTGPMITDDPIWGGPHYYGVLVLRDGDIPAPAASALLALAGLVSRRRRA